MATNDRLRLLLTGGGTGGHLFPAVATAEQFLKLNSDTEVLFVGTRRKIDTNSLAKYGFSSKSILCYGLKGKSPLELIKALIVLPLSFFQALLIVRRFKPSVILGVGGYVTGPVVAAGRCLGIPVVIHEQNSVPGLANRKLGAIADIVCLSLPGSERFFPRAKTRFTGNPVRQNILALTNNSKVESPGYKTVLVLGGSQGAHSVNRLMVDAICSLPETKKQGMQIIHQTGGKDELWVRDTYKIHGVSASVSSFIDGMGEVYQSADLVVSRAGATTLSEIAVLGKPAILIPYPYAADNHQVQNGNHYVVGGGALQYEENDFSATKLADSLVDLLENDKELEKMSRAMKNLSYSDAAERIVACCLEEIGNNE